jgi:type I restriction enzyme S subunit
MVDSSYVWRAFGDREISLSSRQAQREARGLSEGNGLPPGWLLVRLKDVAAPKRITAKPTDFPTLPYIGMEHVESETMRLIGTVPAGTLKSNALRFHPNDVLYGRLRPYLNKVFQPNFEGLCSAEFIVLESSAADSTYLRYFLNSWGFKQFASSLNTGDRPRVDWNQLRDCSLPIPPLPEQRRIVAAIEEQFARLDAGVAALERTRANLKRYRASVLRAAIEGRLTEEWREEYADAEDASPLLERILEERHARWEEAQLARYEKAGKAPPKGWQSKYKEPLAPDTTDLPELPEGWLWVRAEQVCDFITKGTTPAAAKLRRDSGDVPFIKVYNLTFDGSLNFRVQPTFISRETHDGELARSGVFPGDVLMNIVGPPLGKVSVIPDLYPEWNMNQAVAVFRPMPSYNRKFLCLSLLAEPTLSRAQRLAKATAGQFNLTLEICRDLPLPLPPLAEQEELVAEVERRLSVVEEVEAQVEAGLKRAARLRQSILKRAFEGKLVPQDPSDEPASVLLERIREERSAQEKPNNEKANRKNSGRYSAPVPRARDAEQPGLF